MNMARFSANVVENGSEQPGAHVSRERLGELHITWINFSLIVASNSRFFFFFLNQSILFIVSAMSTAGKRSNTISTSLCNAIATYS